MPVSSNVTPPSPSSSRRNKLRVAILSPYPTYPFACELGCTNPSFASNATWTIALARHLAKLPETEVHVVTEATDIPQTTILHDGPVTLHFIKSSARFKTLSCYQTSKHSLHRALASIQPHIVHGEGIENQYGYAAVTSRYPHLLTIHGIPRPANVALGFRGFRPEGFYGWLVERLGARTLRLACNIVVINPYVAQACGLKEGRQRLFFIPNAIAEHFFETSSPPPDGKLVLGIGSIDRRKAWDVLLQALSLLRSRGLNPRAIVAGPPAEAALLADLQRRSQAEQLNVSFTGFIPPSEVVALMQQAGVLALSSRHETAPMVVAEAMALGLPVVASRVGGIPHMIECGKTGLLFDSENAAQLADCLQQVLQNQPLRLQLSANARQTARATYHPRRVAELTRAAYEEILRGSSP